MKSKAIYGTPLNRTRTRYLLENIENAFIYIVPEFVLTPAITTIRRERDYDVIRESVGTYYLNYFLTGEQYIPERICAKFNRITNAMTEHGFYEFYWSLARFVSRIREHEPNENENQFRQISLKQLTFLFIQYLFLNGFATMVFCMEIIRCHVCKKCKKRRIHRFRRNRLGK